MDLAFGASRMVYAQRLSLYLPDCNCFGDPIPDFESWITEAAHLLTSIAGGATRNAPSFGYWYNSTENKLIEERTHVVYANCDQTTVWRNEHRVREFICRFGNETLQETALVEFAGKLYFIDDFEQLQQPKLKAVRLTLP